MRVVDGGRHQRRRLAAGVSEHQALVARALVLVPGRVDALGDVWAVRGLGVEVVADFRVLPVKPLLLVADVADRFARPVFDLVLSDGAGASHLPGDHDEVRRAQRLASDARSGVGAEVQVDDGVGDPVADLVRMPFRDRLAGEQMACHGGVPGDVSKRRTFRLAGSAGETDRLARWSRNQGPGWMSSIFCPRFDRQGMIASSPVSNPRVVSGWRAAFGRSAYPRPLRGSRAPCPPIRSPSRVRPGTSGGSPR